MPDWNPLDTFGSRLVSVGLVGVSGQLDRVRLNDLGTETYVANEVDLFRAAVADMTNAGVHEVKQESTVQVAIINATAYDDANDNGVALQCVLEDDGANIRSFYVAAPKLALFESDGVTLIAGDGAAAAGTPARIAYDFARAAENLINNSFSPPTTYEFIRGILRTNKVKLPDSPPKPQIVEP